MARCDLKISIHKTQTHTHAHTPTPPPPPTHPHTHTLRPQKPVSLSPIQVQLCALDGPVRKNVYSEARTKFDEMLTGTEKETGEDYGTIRNDVKVGVWPAWTPLGGRISRHLSRPARPRWPAWKQCTRPLLNRSRPLLTRPDPDPFSPDICLLTLTPSHPLSHLFRSAPDPFSTDPDPFSTASDPFSPAPDPFSPAPDTTPSQDNHLVVSDLRGGGKYVFRLGLTCRVRVRVRVSPNKHTSPGGGADRLPI